MSEEKLDFTMICTEFLRGVTRVMADGERKHGRDTWKNSEHKDYDLLRLKSLLRHTIDLIDGNYIDAESGFPNIDHIAANCMIIRYHQALKGLINKKSTSSIELEATEETEFILRDKLYVPSAFGQIIPDANNPCLKKRLKDHKKLDDNQGSGYNGSIH